MKLGPKITLGYALSAFLVVVVALVSYRATESVERQQEMLIEAVMPNLQALQEIEASGLRIMAITAELIWMHALDPNVVQSEVWQEELVELQEKAIKPYDIAIGHYRSTAENLVEHELVFVETIDDWGGRLKDASQRLVMLETRDGSAAELNEVREELEQIEEGFLFSIAAAKAHENQDLKLETENLQQVLHEVRMRIVVGSGLAFVIAIVLGLLYARSLSRPIIALKDAAVALGRGDLNSRVSIDSHDELGTLARSFNEMGDALSKAAAVFENTSEGVVIADAAVNIIAVNQAFTEITGYEEGEVLGENPRMFKSQRHEQAFYAEMWTQLLDKGLWRGEVWNRRKNGEIFPVWESIRAIRDANGNVSHFVSVFSDISSLKQSQEKLDYLAYHDPLTNLPNRLLFEDRLGHALSHARRTGHKLALLVLDLDRFKNINDSLGHPVGDRLLIEVAARLKQLVRQEDTVARIGGDEFVVVMEKFSREEEVASLANKLLKAFHEAIVLGEIELHVTLSVGISLFPADGDDVPALVKNADAALYQAKEEGRNDFKFYTESLTTAVFERLALETALRGAVKEQQLLLYYQPLMDLKSGRLIGAEALLRWRHPTFGLVEPNRFIALAEDTGLIIGIGEWVLFEACRQARQWMARGHALEMIAVNVSGLQIQRGNFEATVAAALQSSGLDADCLEVEITENVIMQKTDKVIETLHCLKQMGVKIAIDDFGTGYSSLSYLKQLPVDKLKIDKSFVFDLTAESHDEAIACAVNALAKTLRLKVVAEGIESLQQERFLRNIGCDVGQGFLYSRPIPAAEFELMLKKQEI